MATGYYFDCDRKGFLAVPLIDSTEMSDWESSRKSVAMSTLSY